MFYYFASGFSPHSNQYTCISTQMNPFLLGPIQNETQFQQNYRVLFTNFFSEEILKGYINNFSHQNLVSNQYFSQNQQLQFFSANSVEKNQCEKRVEHEEVKIRSSSDAFDSTSKQSHPENQEQKETSHKKKKSQTKNLIKNYGRAILTFMIKQKELRLKVLSHLKINDEEFLEEIQNYRNHIHTISALRYLWQHHPFSQAFRILSCEYLRKHNLEHIFNSRVFKYNVYLKYQQKLMKSMQKPQEFQSIKQD